jgi:predicted DNA-binding protein with PD1-like motif
MKSKRIDAIDHRLVLLEKGDRWPESLIEAIEKAGLTSGTFRGSAVLREVEVRTFDSAAAQREGGRTLEGPVEATTLEGAFGLTRGTLALTTRAVLALRDSFGERIAAGAVESARVDGGEVLVSGFAGTDLVRTMRSDAGVWLFQLEAELAGTAPRLAAREDEPRAAPPQARANFAASSAWAALADASDAVSSAPAPSHTPMRPGVAKTTQPGRLPNASASDDEPLVEQGAVVDHFTFGEGDVLKSDGERVHVRFDRDGRIREFSLAVLKVSAAGTRRGKPYFKVAKKS